jgi:hypothetical protein
VIVGTLALIALMIVAFDLTWVLLEHFESGR